MDISEINVDNSCRTCLLTTHNLESLFETLYDSSPLSQIVCSIVSIEIQERDKLPHKICANCRTNAINAYKFQQMCVTNDKKIRMLFENRTEFDLDNAIKTERAGDVSQDDLVEASLDITLQGDSNDVMMANLKSLDEEFESETPNDSQDDFTDTETSSSGSDGDDEDKCKNYSCDSCEKRFKSDRKLEQHMRNFHEMAKKSKSAGSDENESSDDDDDSAKIYSCDACAKKFKKPSLLARHVKTHDPNRRPHECSKCQKRFPSSASLVRHDILHSELVERSKINRPQQDFICIICGRCSKSPESLSAHLKTHKNKSIEEQQYECKLCHDVFPTFSDIFRHSKNHIENATHQCAICNKLFVVGDELIDHFLRHKGMKPHQCPVCEKSFLKLHKLNVHMRTHSDDKLNSFLCPECGKSLSTNENLKRHLIRHTGIKPYACSLCPSRFVFKSGLTSHMSTHTGLKPFICDICGSSFTKSSSLTKHHRIHTGERPYVCEVCGMRFNSSDHVKRHMRTHTGERPYKCNFCDRSYAQSNDLLKHTRIHVGENTYKCNLCTAAFRLQAQLRDHYRIHYDSNNVLLRNIDAPDQKPLVSEMGIIVDDQEQQRSRDQELQFAQHFEMIKNEKNESDLIESDKMLYEDLSAHKKQKLDQ